MIAPKPAPDGEPGGANLAADLSERLGAATTCFEMSVGGYVIIQ
jgi:hypothetical protein